VRAPAGERDGFPQRRLRLICLSGRSLELAQVEEPGHQEGVRPRTPFQRNELALAGESAGVVAPGGQDAADALERVALAGAAAGRIEHDYGLVEPTSRFVEIVAAEGSPAESVECAAFLQPNTECSRK